MRAAILSLVFMVAIGTGCKVKNPNFCEDTDGVACDAGVDAPEKCSATDTCATGVCKEPPGVCVECLTNTQCTTATAPVCNATSNKCEKCTAHNQCSDSNVCLPDGSCADKNQVAYLSSGGTDNAVCLKDQKCNDFMKALATPRPYIKLDGMLMGNFTINRTVTLLGDPNAKLSANGGTILTATAGTIRIHDVALDGQGNNTLGFSITTGQTPIVTFDRCVITKNDLGGVLISGGDFSIRNSKVELNQGGGIQVTSALKYTITNNFITSNGLDISGGSTYGGVSLAGNVEGNKLEFNTIAFNRSDGGVVAGVKCDGTNAKVNGNIVYANRDTTGGVSMPTQSGGSCTFQTNLITGVNVGVAPDLGFAQPLTQPTSFKLTTGSPAEVKDMIVSGCPPTDFEGDTRPTGAGCELGADELK